MLKRLLLFFSLTLALSACMGEVPQEKRYKVVNDAPDIAPAARALPSAERPPPLEPIPANLPTVKIALLLPLSGDQQALGQAMLDAATLALYDEYFVMKAGNIKARLVLMPKDTGNSPTTAVAAAEEVLKQGAQIIVGPVFSPYVTAIAPLARKAGVPMLTLSNNRAVAGEGVYLLGFMPEQQAARIAEYASLKSLTSFGALAPNDAYGKAVTEAMAGALGARGITVSPVEMYAARSTANLEAAVTRLKGGYDRTPFKALLIAEGGEQLKQILNYLKAQQITRENVRLLGTGLWDEAEIFTNPDMQGAWFASAAPNYYRPFAKRFEAVYGYYPQRIASLAYDAVALASKLSQEKGGAHFDAATLTSRKGYLGPANGLYRLNADGTNTRALAVIEIRQGQAKSLDPAPLNFDNLEEAKAPEKAPPAAPAPARSAPAAP